MDGNIKNLFPRFGKEKMISEGVRPVTILYLVLSFLLMGVSGSILST